MLYASERWLPEDAGTTLTYRIPVPVTGLYHIVLHFAEKYQPAAVSNERLFDIFINGKEAIRNFDVAAEKGFSRAVARSFSIKVKSGKIVEIALERRKQNPMLSALEVIADVSLGAVMPLTPAPYSPPTSTQPSIIVNDNKGISTTVIAISTSTASTVQVTSGFVPDVSQGKVPALYRINCGSAKSYVDSAGNVWSSDEYFVHGDLTDTYSVEEQSSSSASSDSQPFAITNTFDAPLFTTERFGSDIVSGLAYAFPVESAPGGTPYRITLYFAEIFAPNAAQGARVFDIELENTIFTSDYDIMLNANAFASAVAKVYQVLVADNELNLVLVPQLSADGPKISAIMITQV